MRRVAKGDVTPGRRIAIVYTTPWPEVAEAPDAFAVGPEYVFLLERPDADGPAHLVNTTQGWHGLRDERAVPDEGNAVRLSPSVQTYLTAGFKESLAWTVPVGATARRRRRRVRRRLARQGQQSLRGGRLRSPRVRCRHDGNAVFDMGRPCGRYVSAPRRYTRSLGFRINGKNGCYTTETSNRMSDMDATLSSGAAEIMAQSADAAAHQNALTEIQQQSDDMAASQGKSLNKAEADVQSLI